MSTFAIDPPRRRLAIPLWLLGGVLAVVIGLCLGDPGPESLAVLGLVTVGGVLFAAAVAPFAGFLVLVTSSIMLIVMSIGEGERNLTSFDVLQFPLLAVTFLSGAAALARRSEQAEQGTAHSELRAATRKFTDAVWQYVGLAALSLLVTVAMGKTAGGIDSGLKLVRAMQGMLMFPLALVWLRRERDFRYAIGALLFGGVLFAIINGFAIGTGSAVRAGMTWFANEPLWSMGDPIEAGTAMLMLWVLLLTRQSMEPRPTRWLMLAGILALLVLSQSRSGLLAWVVFSLATLRRVRGRYLLFGLALILLGAPFFASSWWERMSRTLVLERGSFEAYSSLIRVYGWRAAILMFLDHPVFGVGYLGFRHFSDRYNELGIVLGQAESLYLETATGMGVIGLFVAGRAVKRMLDLGRVVRRHAPHGSLAWHLAGFHVPYMAGLLVANLTGDNWVGMLGLAQVGIWCALLVRSGHLSFDSPPAS